MVFLTGVVSTGYAMRLGQYPMTNQKVLVLIAGIIHGKPILDMFLTQLPPIIQLCRQNMALAFMYQGIFDFEAILCCSFQHNLIAKSSKQCLLLYFCSAVQCRTNSSNSLQMVLTSRGWVFFKGKEDIIHLHNFSAGFWHITGTNTYLQKRCYMIKNIHIVQT